MWLDTLSVEDLEWVINQQIKTLSMLATIKLVRANLTHEKV